ncbi:MULTISPECIES: potassium channel family protein [Cyanophyceae]|uniref:Potassium channel family protein n=1 Tax=Leptolyngbya subtilissima DQ-A4 TaxID=2933933 RepID=A0ABV0K151_9CYAN|nr:potassium channel family protein [Nodosilinea sp. FACHB-141]MBD2111274.1 two pore domain potassium channel family protein [Nodosilinea sp. FACHB-141]
MQIILISLGTVIVLLALADIFLTVLHPRSESSVLSIPVARAVWWLFLRIAPLKKRRDHFLSYGGPAIIVTIVGVWVLLLLVGFALIVWPALGTTIQVKEGESPTDFFAAVYYVGFALTTLGIGDFTPQTSFQRLLIVLQGILGYSVLTLTLSYVTAIYSNLTRRKSFALSLHHGTADTADSAELLARLAADNNINTLNQDISETAQNLMELLESNKSYPVLLYFRYSQDYYALPRILYLTMDVATLVGSALDQRKYRSIIRSAGAAELWFGSKHLLEEICHTLLPHIRVPSQELQESRWREHYYQALERLEMEGISITANPEAGVESYVSMRHQWAESLAKLIKYMAYEPEQIFPNLSRTAMNSSSSTLFDPGDYPFKS